MYGEEIRLKIGGRPGRHRLERNPLVRGQWQEFIFHVKWSPDARGLRRALLRRGAGAAQEQPGTNMYAGESRTHLKLGLYRSPTAAGGRRLRRRVHPGDDEGRRVSSPSAACHDSGCRTPRIRFPGTGRADASPPTENGSVADDPVQMSSTPRDWVAIRSQEPGRRRFLWVWRPSAFFADAAGHALDAPAPGPDARMGAGAGDSSRC